MSILFIDFETFSNVNLKKSGVYNYIEAPDFQILLLGYAFDDELIATIDLASGESIPGRVASALLDPFTIKSAFNANFERVCLAQHFGLEMPPEQWHCSSVHARILGLPGSLEGAGKALKIEKEKLTTGAALIRYFCTPCRPTKANGGRTRNLPEHAPEKWLEFKKYNTRDVDAEREILNKVKQFPIPEIEQKAWVLDQKINDLGVRVDPVLVNNAILCDSAYQERVAAEAIQLTGLSNPKSVHQLKAWLFETEGVEVESLTKETIPELMAKRHLFPQKVAVFLWVTSAQLRPG